MISACSGSLSANKAHPEEAYTSAFHAAIALRSNATCAGRISSRSQRTRCCFSHASEAAVNKQLADKERVAAALENPNLLQMVERCLGASAP